MCLGASTEIQVVVQTAEVRRYLKTASTRRWSSPLVGRPNLPATEQTCGSTVRSLRQSRFAKQRSFVQSIAQRRESRVPPAFGVSLDEGDGWGLWSARCGARLRRLADLTGRRFTADRSLPERDGEQDVEADECEVARDEEGEPGSARKRVEVGVLELREPSRSGEDYGRHVADPAADERHDRQKPYDVLRREHLPESHITHESHREREDEPLAVASPRRYQTAGAMSAASAMQLETIPATVGTPPTRSIEFRPPTIVCAWYRPIRSATRSAVAERLSTSTWRVTCS
jgi:hypothetical protein